VELDVHRQRQQVSCIKVAALSSAELNAMTDSQIDELIDGMHQLETSNRRWKKMVLGASTLIGLLVLTLVIVTAMLARQAEDNERKARETAEQLMNERERTLLLIEQEEENKRRAMEATARAVRELRKELGQWERPPGGGPGLNP
jgi:hypothetical protein